MACVLRAGAINVKGKNSIRKLQHATSNSVSRRGFEVNPSVLIGFSRSGFCHTDRFHGDGHKPCIFCFQKAVNSNSSAI